MEVPKIDGYDVVRFLCKGGEGKIYVVTKKGDEKKEEYVLKIRTCLGIEEANNAIQEVLAMGRVAGPYNVAIRDAFLSQVEGSQDEFYIMLVMEYCRGGDLHSFLRQGNRMDPDQVLDFTLEILMGLNTIHKIFLVHRDLVRISLLLLLVLFC